MTPEWLRYQNQGATRNKPLAPGLIDALSYLPEMGIEMRVFSGGQAPKGSGGARTGSTRHDHGNAADADFYYQGRKLDWNNPDDVPIFQEMVQRGKQRGITGWGAGDDYMGAGRMHVGFGNPGVWGAGGKGANAPGWLREAYHGEPGHVHKPGDENQKIADATMAAIGKAPITQPSGGGGTPTAIGSAGQDNLTGGIMADTQPEMAGGILGSLFPSMTADRKDRIALALSGMTLNPNRGLQAAVTGRMAERAETRKEQKAEQKAAQQANKTAAWLATQPGGEQYAQAIANGALPATQALQMWQAQAKGGDDRTALMQNVEYIMQRNPGMPFDEALQMARNGGTTVNVNGDQPAAPDAVLREEMQKDQATSLTAIADAGTKAASVRSDIEALRQLAEVAPSGPLEGRFAEMFPEFNDAAAARQAIIKRVAPTLRVEGSGSTSDIEYAGMIEGMGRLTNRPEANVAIADMMLAKSNLDLQRSELVSAYQRGEVPYNDMLSRLDELNRTSIMPPSLRKLLETTTQGAQNGLPSVGDIVEGHRFNGGDPADPKSWTKVQ